MTARFGTPDWAPASSATMHPGVRARTNGAQRTSNFVFSNGVGDLAMGLTYRNNHSTVGAVHLVKGTTAFRGPLL